MRQGKDQTYVLPILVIFINNYLRGLAHLKESNFFELVYTDPIAKNMRDQYQEAVKCSTFESLSIHKCPIKIPKSSYYRVVNKLVINGYLQRKIIEISITPKFCITLKGILFITKSFKYF